MSKPEIPMIGRQFGNLTVLSRAEREAKIAYWTCQCSCGSVVEVSGADLRRRSRADGHRACQRWRNPDAEVNRSYSNYKHNARRRGLSFDITPEMFKEIVVKDCGYCGRPPEISTAKTSVRFFPVRVAMHGMDRIDSVEGYSVSNVRPCCRECNLMKWDFTEAEFVARCRRISEFCS